MFELGKNLLDRVEVGAIRRQEEEFGAYAADGVANGFSLVAAKIVHDDDVAGFEAGQKERPDIGEELDAVDRPVKDARRLDPVAAQCSQECLGSPVTVRYPADQALAASAPAAQRRHVRLGPGLIDEDETGRINLCLIFFPLSSPPGDVRTALLAGDCGFF